MTKDEFIRLATTPKHYPETSVFTLRLFLRREDVGCYLIVDELGQCEIPLSCLKGIYSSKEEALRAFHDYRSPPDFPSMKIHSARIERTPLNVAVNTDEIIEWWMLDSMGKEIDRSVCSDFHSQDTKNYLGAYFGRTPEKIRFKEGDTVEINQYDENRSVRLGIITCLPPSVEDIWERYNQFSRTHGKVPDDDYRYFPDSMSDSYFALCLDGTDVQLAPSEIINPTYPIPETIQKRLQDIYSVWKSDIDKKSYSLIIKNVKL